jgi:vitamin B12 transporter
MFVRLPWACALITLLAVPAARAQQPAAPDSAHRDTLHHYRLPPVVVTATVVPTAQPQLGVATSVLTRSDLAAEPASAARALTMLPSVALEEDNGSGGPVVMHLRGGDQTYTQTMFDGVPINISGGFNDLNGVLLTNVERVEVARGPVSALWGSAAMSGAVQFITREGQPGPIQFEFNGEGGAATQYGSQAHSELDASGGSDRLRYSSGLGFAYNRGIFALPTDQLSGDGSLRVDADVAPHFTVTATARYRDFQTYEPVRNPGATRVPLDTSARYGDHRWMASVVANWDESPTWHHRLSAQLLWDGFNYASAAESLPPDTISYANYNIRYLSTLLRPALEYVGTKHLSVGTTSWVALSFGAAWQEEVETDHTSGDFGPSSDNINRNNEAGFVEVQGQLGPRVSVLAGERVEQYEGLSAVSMPRGYVVYALVPHVLSLRAAAGRAFVVPNLTTEYTPVPGFVPNPNLKPQSSVSWEVGATWTPDPTWSISLGYYDQQNQDLFVNVPVTGDSTETTDANVGKTEAKGVEFELKARWNTRWSAGVAGSWTQTKILDNTGLAPSQYPLGGSLTAIPALTGNVYVSGALSSHLEALARVTFIGSDTVFLDAFDGPRVGLAPYGLVAFLLTWHARPGLDLYARFSNVLNAAYATGFDDPGIPRTVVLGMRSVF